MTVRIYQSMKAVLLTLALGALFAPSALADPPSGLDPWAYNALKQHQVRNTVPVSENTIGLRHEPSISASRGGLDPWAYNVLRRHQAASSTLVSENTIGLTDKPSFSTSLRGLDPWTYNALRRSQLAATATGEHMAVPGAAPAAPTTLGGFRWGDVAIGASLAALLGLLSVGGTIARRRRASLAH